MCSTRLASCHTCLLYSSYFEESKAPEAILNSASLSAGPANCSCQASSTPIMNWNHRGTPTMNSRHKGTAWPHIPPPLRLHAATRARGCAIPSASVQKDLVMQGAAHGTAVTDNLPAVAHHCRGQCNLPGMHSHPPSPLQLGLLHPVPVHPSLSLSNTLEQRRVEGPCGGLFLRPPHQRPTSGRVHLWGAHLCAPSRSTEASCELDDQNKHRLQRCVSNSSVTELEWQLTTIECSLR